MRNSYPLTIGSLLKQTVDRSCPAEIVYGTTRLTWPKLAHRVNGLAGGLASMGAVAGCKVAVIDIDTNQYLEAYFGQSHHKRNAPQDKHMKARQEAPQRGVHHGADAIPG